MNYDELVLLSKSLLADEAIQLIPLLEDKLDAKESISQIIQRNKIKIKCPYCKGKTIKYGTKNNIQRYKCLECNRTFSNTTNTITYKTHFRFNKWIKFIHCELLGLTIVQTAKEIDVTEPTVFSWRHKLYAAIGKVKQNIVLEGKVQIDATFTSINLKGTKPQNMPRTSKKRGGTSSSGGISHKVCIMCAIDESENMMIEIVGVGSEDKDKMRKIGYKLRDCTTLISDSKQAFRWWTKDNQKKSITIKSYAEYKNQWGYTINKVNQLHSEIKEMISELHGVYIRHLQGYLDMFLFRKLIKRLELEDDDIYTFNKAVPSKTKLIIKDIFTKAIPIDLKKIYGEYKYGIFKDD